jgi:hypothetical protein
MDATRFDALLRSLSSSPSRRDIARLVTGLAFGAAGAAAVAETEAKKKKCPACRTRRKGKCKKKKPDGTPCGNACKTCQNGACRPLPDGTSCGEDACAQCQNGACVVLADGSPCSPGHTCVNGVCPTCPAVAGGSNKAVGDPCNADTPEECSSGVCGCSFTACPCFCRNPDCAETGESCEGKGTLGCCVGLCQNGNPDVCIA